MIVGSRQRLNQINSDPDILIGDHKIKRVSNKKFKGVVLDEQLNWHNHIDNQCARISKNISLLRKAKSFLTENTLTRCCLHFMSLKDRPDVDNQCSVFKITVE